MKNVNHQGGKVVADNLCLIEGPEDIEITNFRERHIEIPKDVQRLFFRFPYEIKVEKKIDGRGTSIGTFEETYTRFYWED